MYRSTATNNLIADCDPCHTPVTGPGRRRRDRVDPSGAGAVWLGPRGRGCRGDPVGGAVDDRGHRGRRGLPELGARGRAVSRATGAVVARIAVVPSPTNSARTTRIQIPARLQYTSAALQLFALAIAQFRESAVLRSGDLARPRPFTRTSLAGPHGLHLCSCLHNTPNDGMCHWLTI